jgi:DNA-binding transcriptional LysR family regulator
VFAKHHYTPNIKMILGGNEVVRLGVLQNLGVTVAAVATLLDEIEREEIVVLDVEGFPIHRQWYLVYPKGKSLSMAAQKLIELLRQEALALTSKLQARLLSQVTVDFE